ncbi:Imm21 family immunity protein [Streptomyces sp. WI04-05B]|uniref:Imm21 family immunity protein n=1 Tax=Streptomyces TaxID=1883 RepID=UPI0029A312CB|nr:MULTISPECIES: Imm21 family immunity protein [unclassified Streptomyces]MDX2545423.1 Imm21 family immunity protein [Streptomyces sp. WI04-05B]MDX2581810.1 Imm21 family immunity protein [Streptomyces sp. WI04-05A]
MNSSNDAASTRHTQPELNWVASMGGPLIVIPVSALQEWSGCTEDGMIIGDTDDPDHYDRACAVEDLAAVIDVGPAGAQALVLGDEPATTCYLPERRAFVRWLAADSDAELLVAAERLLDDPTTEWEAAGVWETDGPAMLMDSAEAGTDLDRPYPDRPELPEQAPVAVPAGRWKIRAVHVTNEFPWVGVVQLTPERGADVSASKADISPHP